MPAFTPFNFSFNANKLISAHLQKKLNVIMMNAIHSVMKYGWLMHNIPIKDLIVSFSNLHGTA